MLNRHFPEPSPGPDCVSFVDLLPLLDEDLLHELEASRLRAHLAACAYCQRERAAYERIAANLRHHFGAQPLRLSPEDIMALSDEKPASEAARAAAPQARGTPPASPRLWLRLARPQTRLRRFASLFSAVAAVLVIGVVVTALIASRGALPKTTRTTNPVASSPTLTATSAPQESAYVPNPNGDILQNVQMLSLTDGWAVGGAWKETGSQSGILSALILHYSDGQWKRVPAPSDEEIGLPDAELYGIAMVSADEGWAVGSGDFYESTIPSAFILHYSGGKWTRFSVLRDAELYNVQMLSPTDGWANGGGGWGTDQGATTSILLHYDGTGWTPVQVPRIAGISSLDMLSATDGWATGTDAILHYDGKQWSIFQHVPGVYGLSLDSASDGWAIGFINYPYNHTSSSNVIWHYNGRRWVQESLPGTVNADAQVLAISMDAPTDGWAVGYGNGGKYQARYALYLHYTHGRWTQVQGPGKDNINGITMLSADEGWAVGNGGVVMHYEHGAWSQYHFLASGG